MNPLVSTEWLEEHLSRPQISIVDASWHMPEKQRNAQAEYENTHIPGAAFADIDLLSDPQSPYPHMLPAPEAFAQGMEALGINTTNHVIVYDAAGLFSAARLWWMLRVFGHERVSVLDGGLPKWRAEGRPTQTGAVIPPKGAFHATFNAFLGAESDDVLHHIKEITACIVDARSAERFAGSVPEPRPGLRSGHIPGSCNLPYSKLLNADMTLKSPLEIKVLFQESGADLTKPVITSCGSGITACILALALYICGKKDVAVYDGSWAQWGACEQLPLA